LKKLIAFSILFIGLAALAYPKIRPLFDSSETSGQRNFSAVSQVIEVDAVEVAPEQIDDQIYSSGTVQANEVVELSAETSGIVTDVYIEEGSEVEEGDLLLKINDSELQAEKQRAEFRLSLAEQREERQRRLLERGGISQDDYDATLNEVHVLRSELRLINARIAKTELRAPFSGIIGLKYVSKGSFIGPDTRIASLQELNPVKIDFSVPERYINRVTVGDRIAFTVQGVDSTFSGEVYAIEPRINTQTRTLQIRAISENEDRILYPGAFANIELILEEIGNAYMVPSISIVPELNSQKVYVVQDGVVEERQIETGIRNSEKVQVVRGLSEGDTVLTTGILQVRPGAEVNITNITKTTEI
jgi:membrane fusion protein (multidrug efflux system)